MGAKSGLSTYNLRQQICHWIFLVKGDKPGKFKQIKNCFKELKHAHRNCLTDLLDNPSPMRDTKLAGLPVLMVNFFKKAKTGL